MPRLVSQHQEGSDVARLSAIAVRIKQPLHRCHARVGRRVEGGHGVCHVRCRAGAASHGTSRQSAVVTECSDRVEPERSEYAAGSDGRHAEHQQASHAERVPSHVTPKALEGPFELRYAVPDVVGLVRAYRKRCLPARREPSLR